MIAHQAVQDDVLEVGREAINGAYQVVSEYGIKLLCALEQIVSLVACIQPPGPHIDALLPITKNDLTVLKYPELFGFFFVTESLISSDAVIAVYDSMNAFMITCKQQKKRW